MCNVCVAGRSLNGSFSLHGFDIRSRGEAEFAMATYQIRKVGDSWPEHWASTLDLAGTLGALGFDDRELNSKRRCLLNSISKSLKKYKLTAIYPANPYIHRTLVWDDIWIDPIKFLKQKYESWINSVDKVPLSK